MSAQHEVEGFSSVFVEAYSGNEAAKTTLALRETLLGQGYREEAASAISQMGGILPIITDLVATDLDMDRQTKLDIYGNMTEVINDGFIAAFGPRSYEGRKLICRRLKLIEVYAFKKSITEGSDWSMRTYSEVSMLRLDCLAKLPRLSRRERVERQQAIALKLANKVMGNIVERFPLELSAWNTDATVDEAVPAVA